MFVLNLRKLLEMVIPGINKDARDSLLLLQFVSGIQNQSTKDFRRSENTCEVVVTHA